ncbi:MAG TPA: hypothetical protein VLH84_04915 [Patescibacteria group bacterium]|nr:hypothetical protein [Patescibacteria group bacterium]
MPRYTPLEVVAPPIVVGEFTDTYNEFGGIYSEELREQLARLALDAAEAAEPGIGEEHVWASGFPGGYSDEELTATDAHKLARRSAALAAGLTGEDDFDGFDGDDSNEYNVTERNVFTLRQEKLAITREMLAADAATGLTESDRETGRARLLELDQKIAVLKAQQAANILPIYFATPFSGLRLDSSEDNPLAYIGDVPGVGHVALYNARTMVADPDLRISYKSDDQIRVAGLGLHVIRHALAVVRLEFVEE